MARDDYPVIVYQILAYLYTQLKNGKPVNPELLKPDSQYLRINERYWQYVMENLYTHGYITGIRLTKAWGDEIMIDGLDKAQITPEGIEYLTENSFINKAKGFLKDVKAVVPFI